jgi:hypothetical protein
VISKDESIVAQVCAKIASELTGMTQTDGTAESIQATYLSHFDFVREAVGSIHGFGITTAPATSVTEQELISTFNATPVGTAQTTYAQPASLVIKGTQHGPIPSWLVAQASKAGVTAVYDNRDTATAENRRPMFKAADGTTNARPGRVARPG